MKRPIAPQVDPIGLKEILAQYPTGVTIICSMTKAGMPVGCTISSFSAVSLSPPLVLFSLKLESPSLEIIREHAGFSVNVLGDEHASLARRFARWREDKFAGVDWSIGGLQCPILGDAVAYFECRLWRMYDGGDHKIIVGRVEDTRIQRTGNPLVVHRGEFRRMLDRSPKTGLGSRNRSG